MGQKAEFNVKKRLKDIQIKECVKLYDLEMLCWLFNGNNVNTIIHVAIN